eukprot:CAMPEP_0170457100 /NCGR_PEP_ID=MMETSP0123-20130129/4503_1 /TAXON_ID=182087 /ORGANISM="Favella ehrenbergii, Strain Fehren 1" /LENGTH=63 /DNA_ID=CAMNT_0010720777 /DNA_START=576 /DNA_END=767 /DNA_ORIENTATION=-
MAIIIGIKIHQENITTMNEFYENDKVMKTYEIYLVVNLIVQTGSTLGLFFFTVKLFRSINQFF